jgi:ubiquinone/menaquinone biosynthesis C-methylase UbiE
MTDLMRRDWDDRARRNAFHYIASWQKEWSFDAFLASGEHDYQTFVAPVLERCHIRAEGESMLELGCGAGRMTANFASRYRRVLAMDVSAEMLSRGAKIHSSLENISWLPAPGDNLGTVEGSSVDFVFSYLVLQHMPVEAMAINYILEMLRVLRPGGAFLFQFNSSRAQNMNLRGRIAWGFVDALWSAHLRALSRALATAFGFDPATAGKSWRGAAIDVERVESAIHEGRGVIREIVGENTPMTWCCGIKSADSCERRS